MSSNSELLALNATGANVADRGPHLAWNPACAHAVRPLPAQIGPSFPPNGNEVLPMTPVVGLMNSYHNPVTFVVSKLYR